MTRFGRMLRFVVVLALCLGAAPHAAPAPDETVVLGHADCPVADAADSCAAALCCVWIAEDARAPARPDSGTPPRPTGRAFAASCARAPPPPPPRFG
jgi:hypothetical protein